MYWDPMKGLENLFKENKATYFLNLMHTVKWQLQESYKLQAV